MEVVQKITIPTFVDERGSLSVIEIADFVDWQVKRIYYVTDTKMSRGGHSVKGEKKLYVCVQGSVTGKFHDGEKWIEFSLKGPGEAVRMDDYCWREFDQFSEGSVLMAISNMAYEKDKYIMDFDEHVKYYNGVK